MDSNSLGSSDTKAEFRKPLNDAANRKYRRRSPVCGSSPSSDGSPQHKRENSPTPSRKNIAKIADDKPKKDDGRKLNMDYLSVDGEPYKHSDRQSSRSYNRHDDHGRRDRHVDDYDRGYSKSSYRSSRGSQDIGYSRGDKMPLYRDYLNDVDRYSRENSDASGNRSKGKNTSDREGSGRRHSNVEGRDWDKDRVGHREDSSRDRKTDHRSSRDHKINCSPQYEDRNESYSHRDRAGRHQKETSQRDGKELDSVKCTNEEKRRCDDRDRCNEKRNREPEKHSDDIKASSSKHPDFDAKKPKLPCLDTTGPGTNGTLEKPYVTDSDIDAAKVAAIKAAELVNKNLIGTGYMSTDQKKKLLWGNKKNTTTEEPAHRWNSANFGDLERQEKFNKLMGVKGNTKVEHKPDDPNVEKQREQLQLELEKQYTAGLRRKDGRTVGLGL